MGNDRFHLDGKVALITGASGTIGRGIAHAFVQYGAAVVLMGRRSDSLQQLQREIEHTGGVARVSCCDLSSEEEVQWGIEQVCAHFQRADILVNAAGIFPDTHQAITAALWQEAIAVNLRGLARMCEAVTPLMTKQGYGKIINIASIGGLVIPSAHYELYAATKAAVIHYTKALAVSLARKNIYVNAISPGLVASGMTEWLPPVYRAILCAHTPQQRLGRVQDINGVAIYLASAASNYVTGTNIVVDGGFTTGYMPPLQDVNHRLHQAGMSGEQTITTPVPAAEQNVP